MLIKCDECNQTFEKTKSRIERSKRHFCSRYCQHNHYRKGRVETSCNECGDKVVRQKSQYDRSEVHFCCRSCRVSYFNKRRVGDSHPNYTGGRYRDNALNHYGEICSSNTCPMGNNVDVKMLDVHHKDGNRDNNNIDNLSVLCVWCHALLTRNIKS